MTTRHQNAMNDFERHAEFVKTSIDKLMQEPLRDEDGYPTEAALQIIEIWHWRDVPGWFAFIKSMWAYADWGWSEQDTTYKDKPIREYHISTAGWSGNESIIRAMQKNYMLWHDTWVQSRRGGHYIFKYDTDEVI